MQQKSIRPNFKFRQSIIFKLKFRLGFMTIWVLPGCCDQLAFLYLQQKSIRPNFKFRQSVIFELKFRLGLSMTIWVLPGCCFQLGFLQIWTIGAGYTFGPKSPEFQIKSSDVRARRSKIWVQVRSLLIDLILIKIFRSSNHKFGHEDYWA